MARPSSYDGRRSRSRNRLALAGWRTPHAGLAYGFLDLDVGDAEEWCRETGVTLPQLAGAALGRGLVAVPDLNARVVLGRIRPRPTVDISFAVASQRGGHLTAALVRDADRKDPAEIARELRCATLDVLRGEPHELSRVVRIADRMPGFLLRPGMALAGWVTAALGLPLRPLGLPPHPFGSALLSGVGTFGVDRALAPLLPFARVGCVVTVGSVAWKPRVVDGEVVPKRVVELGVTVDHRLVDGAQGARFAQVLREVIERPWEAWPALGGPVEARARARHP